MTITYLSLFLGTVTARINELISLPLNELGDFAAGAFGPLAFLWLVLGYRQQGEELRASNAALDSQVSELRKSIDMQRTNAEKQDLMLDPVFYVNYVGDETKAGVLCDSLMIYNKGGVCRDVYVTACLENSDYPTQHKHTHAIHNDAPFKLVISEVPPNLMIAIVIKYLRINGTSGMQGFHFVKPSGGNPTTFAFPNY